MLFNSFDFPISFPLTLLVYFLLPLKIRWLWLLAASAYFYMCWKAKYIILIGFSIFVTWAEFWDRWHISLSKWFEDYIYKPFAWVINTI